MPDKQKQPQDNVDPSGFRRRDMLEAERVAGVPFSTLFVEHEGEQAATAMGALAMQYVVEKRSGATDLDFEDWLDEEPDDVEIGSADPS